MSGVPEEFKNPIINTFSQIYEITRDPLKALNTVNDHLIHRIQENSLKETIISQGADYIDFAYYFDQHFFDEEMKEKFKAYDQEEPYLFRFVEAAKPYYLNFLTFYGANHSTEEAKEKRKKIMDFFLKLKPTAMTWDFRLHHEYRTSRYTLDYPEVNDDLLDNLLTLVTVVDSDGYVILTNSNGHYAYRFKNRDQHYTFIEVVLEDE